MDFKNILHNKFFLWGGGLLLLVIIYAHLKGSNNAVGNGVTTTTNSTVQPTDAQVNAQVALATAQIGAASQANTTAATLAAQTQQLQEQLAEKGIDADVAKYSIDAQAASQTQQIQAASVAQQRDDDLQASIAKWTLDNAASMAAQNDNFQLAYANNANSTAIANEQIIAGVSLASIQANRDISTANIAAGVTNTSNIIAGQVALNESNNAAQVSEQQIQANVTKYTQGSGNVKGVLGFLGGIFSDRRLKRDAVLLGVDRDGIRRYAYRYHDSREFQVGVMADEIRRTHPHAMGPRIGGYDTVRYSAL